MHVEPKGFQFGTSKHRILEKKAQSVFSKWKESKLNRRNKTLASLKFCNWFLLTSVFYTHKRGNVKNHGPQKWHDISICWYKLFTKGCPGGYIVRIYNDSQKLKSIES